MIKKSTSLLLVFVLIISLILTSCSKDTGKDKEFLYPIDADPICLDPQIASNSPAELIINNCFEGLVRIDADGKVIPGVAKSWILSPDGLTYTFSLRTDTSWHLIKGLENILGEGYKTKFDSRVTAKDFVFAFKRALDPQTKSPNAISLFLIKNAQEFNEGKLTSDKVGVTATDDNTLVITLSNQNADFLYTLTQAACMPCNEKFFNAVKGKYGLDVNYLICNGPFYLSKWSQGSSLLIRRNGDYKGESSVSPLSVGFNVNPDNSSKLSKIKDGTYSASPIVQENAAALSEQKGITLKEYKNIVWSLNFNCANSRLSNMYTRLGLCFAIDRSSLEVPSNAYPSKGFVPECCTVGNDNFRAISGDADFLEFDAEKAKEFFKKGLIESGFKEIDIKIFCIAEHENIMKKILQRWQQIFGLSFNATIEVLERSDLESKVKSGNYQLALSPIAANSSSAVSFLQNFTSSSVNNVFRYNSNIYDSVVKKLSTIGDSGETAKGCHQCESHLMQNGVLYPFYSQSNFFALGKNISGIYTHPAGENVCFINAEGTD